MNEPFSEPFRILVLIGQFGIALFGALLLIAAIGLAVETAGERSEARDRCLRQATNGLEIRECGR